MSTSNSTQTLFPSLSSHNNVLPSPGKTKTSYYSVGSYPPYLKTSMPKSLGSQLRMKYGKRLKHHMLRTPGLVFYNFGWSCKISKKAPNLPIHKYFQKAKYLAHQLAIATRHIQDEAHILCILGRLLRGPSTNG